MRKFILCMSLLMCFSTQVHADELSDLKQMFQQMQVQMKDMQTRIAELEQEKNAQALKDKSTINQLQTRVEELEQTERSESKSLLSTLNPEVSVIGDFVYKIDENDAEGDNDFNLREVEIAFSANVDTWARGDVIVAIENEDGSTEVGIEEGYLTLLETPVENLQAKFGKFRPYFGKANKMHLHQLPWTDYPLAVQNFLGEEGFSEAGASLNYLLPLPSDIYSELTLEVFNNDSNVVFGGTDERETGYLAHLKNFFEINDETSLEIGGSYMQGQNSNGGGSDTFVSGVDITFNTELFDNLRTTSHTEALFSKAENRGSDDTDAWGMFTSLEQQLTDRWWAFGRYDFSQTPTDSTTDTHAFSTGLTFAQSEYVFWRAMYTHTDNETGDDNNTVWLQMDFSIGPHKPHAYR